MDAPVLPRLAQSPKDPGFVQNPYPVYDQARALGPLVYWQDYAMPAALSYEAVQTILRSRAFARVPPPSHEAPTQWDDLPAFKALEDASMLSNEAPRHPVLRRAVVQAFTSARIKALAPQIETLCHHLIDAFPDGPFDLLAAYATPIPLRTIATMLGEDIAICPALLAWSHAMVRLYTPAPSQADRQAAETAAGDFTAHLRASLARRRPDPDGDLAQALLAQAEADNLTMEEVIGTCVLLLNAGHEATVHSIGNAVALLAPRGDGARLCRPDRVAATAEETLRFDPPLHLFDRWAQTETEVAGHHFRPGDRVACLLAAANRDPETYPDPNRFDPDRFTAPKIPALTSFGAGAHFCLGAPLARLELEIALRVLFERCPKLALATPPRFADIYHFHGLARLDVTLT